MANDDVQTNLRIPGDLKDQLQASAETAGRSLSAEVAYRIGRAFELQAGLDKAVALSEVLRQQVGELRDALQVREAQYTSALNRIAALEGEGHLLRSTRETDIAAATKFLSERIDFLATRAGSAEREALTLSETLRSQQAQNSSNLDRLKTAEAEVESLKRKLAERDGAALDLAPTVVRLERDVARLEVDKDSETLLLRTFAFALRGMLKEHPNEPLDEIFKGATSAEWLAMCDAVIETREVDEDGFESSYARLTSAEAALRRLLPSAADPLWETIGNPRRSRRKQQHDLAPTATVPARTSKRKV